MRNLARRTVTILLFTAAAIALAPTMVPPFLDRIYYRGPKSGHFDGARFFNPGFGAYRGGSPTAFFNRWVSGERADWPDRVAVAPTRPPRRVHAAGGPAFPMLVTWIGHATVLVQSNGLNILTDPIWSERASPFAFAGPRRVRQPGVRFEDLPKIDLVLLSHNHYDHMDLPTLKRLWERDRPLIVTGLGNDTILRGSGIPARALDWGGRVALRPGVAVVVERNHHWSSRWGTDRNRALWSAFTVTLPGGNLFFAGDTGWGDGSWLGEAAARGPMRLAIIPIGAYEPRDFMKTNLVNPEEAVAAFEALRPGVALGVHWGTFQLTFEPIDEPRRKLEALKRQRGIAGGRFVTTEPGQSFSIAPAG